MAAKRDFTDRFLKSIKPIKPATTDKDGKEIKARPLKPGERVIIWDAQVPGFGIRVTDKSRPDDIGAFVLVARFPGSDNPAPRRIGDYPAMPLAKARQLAREWREDIRQGVDPKVKEERQRREEERRRADTFAAAFEAYAEERLSRLRTGAEARHSFERHILPVWGSKPISELHRADVKELVRNLHKTAPIAANRTLSILKTFFKWAAEEELIEASPAAAVKPLAAEIKRDRVLTHSEIRTTWEACGELGAFGRAFRFMLATGQRRSEVGGMTWAELDVKQRLWILPRNRTKADRAHEVPLSDLALSIIGDCPKLNEFVFTTGGDTPISGWSKAKAALDKRATLNGEAISEWHLHDLRRTCATYLAKLGTDRIVISKLFNHAEGGVTSTYDRHARDPEKRMAMDLWGAQLAAIIDGTDENVVPITKARR